MIRFVWLVVALVACGSSSKTDPDAAPDPDAVTEDAGPDAPAMLRPGDFIWDVVAGTANPEHGIAVAVDPQGNVIASGRFAGTIDLGGGNVFTSTPGDPRYHYANFLGKWDANRNLLWAKKIGSSGPNNVFSLATDASGNVYLTGELSGSFDLGGGVLPGRTTPAAITEPYTDMVVAKFSPTGGYLWARRWGTSLYNRGVAIAVGANADVYVSGQFMGTVNFGTGAKTSDIPSATDVVFLRLAGSTGITVWAHQFGGALYDYAGGAAVDAAGNAYFGGYYTGTGRFDDGIDTFPAQGGTTDIDAFLVKFNAAGVRQWARRFGGNAFDEIRSVRCDSAGNVFMAGLYYSSTMALDAITLTNAGGEDGYLAKVDSSGTVMWAHNFGSAGNERINSVAFDSADNVFFAGMFANSVSFGGPTLTSAGLVDIVGGAYNTAGVHQWSRSYGGASDDAMFDLGVNALGDLYMTGRYSGSVSFGGATHTSAGSTDFFLVKLGTRTIL